MMVSLNIHKSREVSLYLIKHDILIRSVSSLSLSLSLLLPLLLLFLLFFLFFMCFMRFFVYGYDYRHCYRYQCYSGYFLIRGQTIFTVDCLVTWPLNGSEAGDLVLTQTSLWFCCANQVFLMLTSWCLHEKSREVFSKARPPLASLAFMARKLSTQL